MTASEFFLWLALTGVVLGPYIIYEAKGRTATTLGWAITASSAIALCYMAWMLIRQPSPNALVVRTLYSDHQSVQARNVPGDFNKILNLDNVATLQVSSPFNLQKITLEWLAVPAVTVENPQTGRDYPMGNETLHIFPHQGTLRGLTVMQGTIVSFDVIANRSRLLPSGGPRL